MDNATAKKVFYASLLFYLALQLFSVFHAPARVCSSHEIAFNDMFYKYDFYDPVHRYGALVNKLMPIAGLIWHIPFKYIIYLYCINDLLYYLAVALLIIFFVKRYDYAAAVLMAPLVLMGPDFYDLCSQLFISGAIAVLYLAVSNEMPPSRKRTIILLCCVPLMIWSHPLILAVLFLFWAATYTSLAQLKRDWGILAFALINIIARSFCFTGHDAGRMDEARDSPHGIAFFVHNVSGYLAHFWFAIVFLLLVFILSSTAAQKRNARLSMLSFVGLLPLCFTGLGTDQYSFAKAFYPFHVFVLILLLGVLCALPPRPKYVVGFISLFLLYVICSQMAMVITGSTPQYADRVKLAIKTDLWCAALNPAQSKWYVRNEKLMQSYPGQFLENGSNPVFLFGQNPSRVTRQVIYTDSENIYKLKAVSDTELYISQNTIIPMDMLDTFYYHINPGEYKELLVDSAFLSYLKLK